MSRGMYRLGRFRIDKLEDGREFRRQPGFGENNGFAIPSFYLRLWWLSFGHVPIAYEPS